MKARRYPIIFGVGFLALASCSTPSQQTPAEAAYEAFKGIQGATAVGVAKLRYDELLQAASKELHILADFAPGTKDTLPLRRYMAALEKYKDADALWAEQIDNARYDWIPKDRIYGTGEVLGIASRYGLAIEDTHAQYVSPFKTVSSSSIQVLWERANADVVSADSLVVPRMRARYR